MIIFAGMNLHQIHNSWIADFPQPLIIAGPCSAEYEEQVLQTAAGIRQSGAAVPVFRAGIWKPRTKPNGFEGVGAIGLEWLKKAKEEFGFRTATEVATARHAEAALAADIDFLWIGARSAANPFTVQEIADALADTGKIILVKNPVNPDLALWIGAFERLSGRGITKLGAIHRGFSTYQKVKYRNNPNWQIALDFKNEFPNIPLLIDPSHICGNREGIAEITQSAMNLGYQGAMIETHFQPEKAWSDAAQQITPHALAEILTNLQLRNSACVGAPERLDQYRAMISDLDLQLINLLSQRFDMVKNIGVIKQEQNLAVFQPERWKIVSEYAARRAEEAKLSPEFVQKIFKTIHEEAVDVQNRLMKTH